MERIERLLYRLYSFLLDIQDLPIVWRPAGVLASRIWVYLYRNRGWRPVDLRAGYRVPDHELKIWRTQLDPRTVGAARSLEAAYHPGERGSDGPCGHPGARGVDAPLGWTPPPPMPEDYLESLKSRLSPLLSDLPEEGKGDGSP